MKPYEISALFWGGVVVVIVGYCLVNKSCLTLLWPCQALLSMWFPRQEYWSGSPFPSPSDLLDPRIEHGSLSLQQAYSLPLSSWASLVVVMVVDFVEEQLPVFLLWKSAFFFVCFVFSDSLQLILEQHGFELCKSTCMRIFFSSKFYRTTWFLFVWM